MTRNLTPVAQGTGGLSARPTRGSINYAKHPLVGSGLHIRNEAGELQYQARILSISPSNSDKGGVAQVQYFSALDGCPTNRGIVAIADMTDTRRFSIYGNMEEANERWNRENEQVWRRTRAS